MDQILPDIHILKDVSRILWQEAKGEIELEEGVVSVPEGTAIEMVTKAFFKEYFEEIKFGTYRVQVAIGGVQDQKFGMLYAKYCFATLYYNEKANLVTLDFHKDMR
jgi:hypothetical protein